MPPLSGEGKRKGMGVEMDFISETVVEETWQEVAQFSPSRAQRELAKLSKTQPQLVKFVFAFTQELSEEATDLALYMLFVVWQMFRKCVPGDIPKISAEEIGQTFRSIEEAMERLEGVHERFLERIAMRHMSAQPYVMGYVVHTLMEAPDGVAQVPLTEEEQACLFLLFRTVIDVLDQAAGGR